jgi:hypothetical protein
MKWQVTLTLPLFYFWERTPEHPYTRGQIGYRANPDVTPKAGIHAPSTKWTSVIYPVPTHFAYSAMLTDMIYLYHTNAYRKFISFPRMYGRLPVKSHTSTLKVTWSPIFTEVPSHSSSVSSVGLGIATWKHLWTRQPMWFTPFLFTMPKHKLKYFQLAHWKTYVRSWHKLPVQL